MPSHLSLVSPRFLHVLRLLLILSLLTGAASASVVQAEPAPQIVTPTLTPVAPPTPTDIATSEPSVTSTLTSTEIVAVTTTATLQPPPTDTLPSGYPLPVDTATSAPTANVIETDIATVSSTPSPTTTLTPTTTVLPVTTPVNEIITDLGGKVIFIFGHAPEGGSEKGALTLDFPAGALDKTANVSIAALDKLPAALPQDVWYKDFGVDVKINTLADGMKVDKTTLPITVTLQYTSTPRQKYAAGFFYTASGRPA